MRGLSKMWFGEFWVLQWCSYFLMHLLETFDPVQLATVTSQVYYAALVWSIWAARLEAGGTWVSWCF